MPVDPEIARALGVRTTVAALLAEPGGADDLLDRLADPDRPVTRRQLRALWAELAAAPDAAPPDRVRAVLGSEIIVADAADALILDAPDLLPVAAGRPLILAPHDRAARLADLLDVPLASEECPGRVESAAERRPVPAIARQVLPGAPAEYLAHDVLTVDGVAAAWRYTGGEVHAAGTSGLACGLAWAAGRWAARHLVAAVLRDPEAAPRLLADADLDLDLADLDPDPDPARPGLRLPRSTPDLHPACSCPPCRLPWPSTPRTNRRQGGVTRLRTTQRGDAP